VRSKSGVALGFTKSDSLVWQHSEVDHVINGSRRIRDDMDMRFPSPRFEEANRVAASVCHLSTVVSDYQQDERLSLVAFQVHRSSHALGMRLSLVVFPNPIRLGDRELGSVAMYKFDSCSYFARDIRNRYLAVLDFSNDRRLVSLRMPAPFIDVAETKRSQVATSRLPSWCASTSFVLRSIATKVQASPMNLGFGSPPCLWALFLKT
jgi:hypothetical protein